MNKCVLVSIIIPVYNALPYLREVLESVIHQTYQYLEIIIVDDGSSDGSGGVCDNYAKSDNRIILIHQENRGLSAARNTGLCKATGDLIAFLDADDAYHPDYIKVMIEDMIREKVDVVICNYRICNSLSSLTENCKGRNRSLHEHGKYDRKTALRNLVDGKLNISAWNKLYRKELWDGIQFPEGRVYEDNGTIYKIIDRCTAIFVTEKVLYYYRIRPGSITDTYLLNSISDLDFNFSQFESFIRENIPEIFTPEQLRLKRQSRLNRMIYCYVWSDNHQEKLMEDLRRDIIAIGEEVGTDQLSPKNMRLYKLICNYPRVLTLLHPFYHSTRRMARELRWKARNIKKLRD